MKGDLKDVNRRLRALESGGSSPDEGLGAQVGGLSKLVYDLRGSVGSLREHVDRLQAEFNASTGDGVPDGVDRGKLKKQLASIGNRLDALEAPVAPPSDDSVGPNDEK